MEAKNPDERPAYVRFEVRAVEDREASIRLGHYSSKDVEFAIITPAGSKDEVEKKVDEWLAQIKQQAREGRMPPQWEEGYRQAYAAWKRGEEIPLSGTPIRGWVVLGPSQQQRCLAANIRTVEDLALINGEGLARIGMGGQELKQKAQAWLSASVNIGVVVQENSALKVKVADLEAQVARLNERNAALAQQLVETGKPQQVVTVTPAAQPVEEKI